MRNSIQRNLVYDIIQVSCDHPTADMVYLRAKQTMPKISLGTVYRNLNELVELGKILRINVPGDSDRFDKMLVKHSHFFCEKCKSILDIKKKYGKNAVLRGLSYEEGATTRTRNGQIGGHKA